MGGEKQNNSGLQSEVKDNVVKYNALRSKKENLILLSIIFCLCNFRQDFLVF